MTDTLETLEPTTFIAERVLNWPDVMREYEQQIPTLLALTGPYRRILNVTQAGDQVKFRVIADDRLEAKYDKEVEEFNKDPRGEQPKKAQVPFALVRLGDRLAGLGQYSMSVAAEIDGVFILVQTSEQSMFGGFGDPFGSIF